MSFVLCCHWPLALFFILYLMICAAIGRDFALSLESFFILFRPWSGGHPFPLGACYFALFSNRYRYCGSVTASLCHHSIAGIDLLCILSSSEVFPSPILINIDFSPAGPLHSITPLAMHDMSSYVCCGGGLLLFMEGGYIDRNVWVSPLEVAWSI